MADLVPDNEQKDTTLSQAQQDSKKGGKKKKMGLGEFLQEGGSWADQPVDWAEESMRGGGGRDYDGGRDSSRYGGREDYGRDRASREPTPVPDNPPYVAYIGNLNFDVTEEEVINFFEAQCTVTSVRMVMDFDGRPKGFGYVEFGDRESLVNSLEANGLEFCGRNIRVDVAEQKDRRGGGFGSSTGPSEADAGPWRRGEALPPREPESAFGGRRGDGPRRDGPRDFDRSDMGRGLSGGPPRSERPRLNLAPRSKPVKEVGVPPAADYASAKNNPFGAAKPRDENEIMRRKEEERARRQAASATSAAASDKPAAAAPAADAAAPAAAQKKGNEPPTNRFASLTTEEGK